VRVAGGKFEMRRIAKEEIPVTFDSTRTYFFHTNSVRPDSLLEALVAAGFKVTNAWYCENADYYCMDTIGPHFTIELASDDPRILEHGFTKGVGRTSCAHQLQSYAPAE
jgi:hypothetical protein